MNAGWNLPYSWFGPSHFSREKLDLPLHSLLGAMAAKKLEPFFEKNDTKGEYEWAITIYPDPIVSWERGWMKGDFLISPSEYTSLVMTHVNVLKFHVEEEPLSFQFKSGEATCVVKHGGIVHYQDGFSIWTLAFSKCKFDASCYFGVRPCPTALALGEEARVWTGEEWYCNSKLFCERGQHWFGCTTHEPGKTECGCEGK